MSNIIQTQLVPIDLIQHTLIQNNIDDVTVNELRDKYLALTIADHTDIEGYNRVNEARKEVKKYRTAVTKICKEGREESNRISKMWIETEKTWVNKFAEIEEVLERRQKVIDDYHAQQAKIKADEEARLKREADEKRMNLIVERTKLLSSVNVAIQSSAELAIMSQEEFDSLYNQGKQKIAELEAERLQKEKEAEEQKKRIEQERLELEEERKKILQAAKLLQEQREALEAENKAKVEEQIAKSIIEDANTASEEELKAASDIYDAIINPQATKTKEEAFLEETPDEDANEPYEEAYAVDYIREGFKVYDSRYFSGNNGDDAAWGILASNQKALEERFVKCEAMLSGFGPETRIIKGLRYMYSIAQFEVEEMDGDIRENAREDFATLWSLMCSCNDVMNALDYDTF